jgi:hypothetical protein
MRVGTDFFFFPYDVHIDTIFMAPVSKELDSLLLLLVPRWIILRKDI